MSETSFIFPLSRSSATVIAPSPSMSIAPRPPKCTMRSKVCAVQAMLVHLVTASPSSRRTSLPQAGHSFGISNGSSSPVRSSTMTFTISGMTSPAFRTITRSPTRTSLRFTSSSLCSVA